MAIVPPPALPLSIFTMTFEAPPASLTQSPYTLDTTYTGKGGGIWKGTVAWDTWDEVFATEQDNEDLLVIFNGLLQGPDNRVGIRMPVRPYQPILPDTTVASLGDLSLTPTGLVARITLSGNDMATLDVGRWINIGTRAYLIRSKSGNDYGLFPTVLPRDQTTIRVLGVIVNARLDAGQPIGTRDDNGSLVNHVYNWIEAA